MNPAIKTITASAAALAAAAFSLSADPVESALDESFKSLEESVPGKFSINARLRYEIFDLDNGNPALDRDGTSLRVRYGYMTPNFQGFTAMVEGETLTRVGGDANDIHPLDDAGDGTDLNQAWVQYADKDTGKVKIGRQIIALDDQRFIGHVGWRQNIQVFDAAYGEFTGVDKLVVKGFYIDERHLVNGLHSETDTFGLNVAYAFDPKFKLTGFYYDIEGEDLAATTSETLGLRATGAFSYEDVKFKYAASIAEQEDGGNPATGDYDAGYIAGDLAATFASGFTLGAGFEILEPSFRTPMATVHKFNGFADALLPLTGFAQGLENYYVYGAFKIPVGNGIKAKVIYHTFDPESGSGDYGDEIDFVASYKFNKYFTGVAKYGSYNSDGGAGGVGGVDKDMFTLELNFKY